jgi:Reverse transcriptase (RNA-dependent DNA polymerase)
VRYADDLVACCHSQRQTEQVKTQLAAWLAPRGLIFNEDKTQIVHLALLTELTTEFAQAVDGAVRVPASLSA